MNADQAKKISLPDLLAMLGHQPVESKKGGQELWYKSPFRPEEDASFHTSFLGGKWIWKDFGDTGGTVIDFVMRHEHFTQVREVLTWLEGKFQGSLFEPEPPRITPHFSFQQQKGREAAENFSEDRGLEFLRADPIQNTVILGYLTNERQIPAELARRYLWEVKYKNLANGREYFAFGMKNQAGGYEVRVASSKYTFKSALIARDITIIPGANPEGAAVSVFEGMTDFLSLLALHGLVQLSGDAIIMHSLSSHQRTVAAIEERGYPIIHAYLDNNKAGQEGSERLKFAFPGRVVAKSPDFAPHVDLNDALRARSAGKEKRGF